MKIGLILAWNRIQKVLEENEKIFPKIYHNRELFMSLYALVSSRCYPEGIIPVADLINHNNDVSSYEFVNTDVHAKGHTFASYFLISRYLACYNQLSPTLTNRFSKQIMDSNNSLLSQSSIRDQLIGSSTLQNKHIW